MTKYSKFTGRFKTGTQNIASPVTGDLWYDTTNNRLMRYNGSYWAGIAFTTSTSTSSTTTSTSTSTTSTSSSTTSTSTSLTTSSSTSISTSTTTTL